MGLPLRALKAASSILLSFHLPIVHVLSPNLSIVKSHLVPNRARLRDPAACLNISAVPIKNYITGSWPNVKRRVFREGTLCSQRSYVSSHIGRNCTGRPIRILMGTLP